MKKKIKLILISTLVLIILSIIYYLIFLPTLSIKFLSGVFFIAIFVIIEFGIIALSLSNDNVGQVGNINKITKVWIMTTITIAILIFLGIILGSPIFNSKKMYNQIGDVKEEAFVDNITQLSNEGIPTVDIQLAYKQGEKTLGSVSGLGSQVTLGKFTMQQVNGKLIYVAPLEHSGFFKWVSNKTTPGYITVSATDANDVKLVQEINGEKINLKYLESSFFAEDLVRYIKLSGNITEGVTDYSFELDDTGRPYYVVTKYTNTIFFGTPEAIGTVICDVQTGEIAEYSIEETPLWVDRIVPEKFIENQIYNFGEYVHGVFNFSNKDKLIKTDGMIIVYNDNNCYYYTGLTSVGSDEAVVGFLMTNTRTKETTKFTMGGATENAAMMSAEGLVQDMGYTATIPVPINLNGIPTYFMTLKDVEGLIKSYALVNIENYSIAVTGSNISEAKRNYIGKLSSIGNDNNLSNNNSKEKIEGVVTRISSNIENGNTSYYMILNNDTTKLYVAPYTISEELPITRENDKVSIEYIDTKLGAIAITEFNNLNYTQESSNKLY